MLVVLLPLPSQIGRLCQNAAFESAAGQSHVSTDPSVFSA